MYYQEEKSGNSSYIISQYHYPSSSFPASGRRAISVSNGDIRAAIDCDYQAAKATCAIVPHGEAVCETWSFIVLTYDGIEMAAYMDGIRKTAVSGALQFPVIDWPTYIGHANYAAHNTPPRFFSGIIDDVCIYDNALSSEEIDSLFRDGGWTSSTPGVIENVFPISKDATLFYHEYPEKSDLHVVEPLFDIGFAHRK